MLTCAIPMTSSTGAGVNNDVVGAIEAVGAAGAAGAAEHRVEEKQHSIYASFNLLKSDAQLRRLGLLTACYYMPVYGCIATLLVYLRTTFEFEAHMGAMLLAAIGSSATIACSLGVRKEKGGENWDGKNAWVVFACVAMCNAKGVFDTPVT